MPTYPKYNAPACHIVGAGLAGLSAARQLIDAGFKVYVYETANHAGGRCRSLPDKRLGSIIDNGSHLIFTANTATLDLMKAIGSPEDGLRRLNSLPFYDLEDKMRWQFTPKGKGPWWVMGAGLKDLGVSRWQVIKDVFRLMIASKEKSIQDCIPTNTMAWQRLWVPFLEAVFNTDSETVSARHAYKVLKALTLHGVDSACPLQAIRPWSDVIANPAVAHLQYHGAIFNFNMTLLALDRSDGIVRKMIFRRGTIDTQNDFVILATPNAVANRLCPDIAPQIDSAPIINMHFEVAEDLGIGLCGMVNGMADWVFWRGKTVSITIGNARKYMRLNSDEIANTVWAEARAVLPSTLPIDPPNFRRIIEKRATIAVTPVAFAKRPSAKTQDTNLFLAGDWTETNLPSTIEGAVVSGIHAAQAVISAAKS